MTPFEVYREYVNLKNHLTKESYDYVKYNGRSTLRFSSYDARADKIYFMKLAKHRDPKGLILANLLINDKAWIGNLAYSADAERAYVEWKKRQESLMYHFKEELGKLPDPLDSLFQVDQVKRMHPRILVMYMRREISLEAFAILTIVTKCENHWSRFFGQDPAYNGVMLKVRKYSQLLTFDREVATKIVQEKATSAA